jgi:RES domain-containing protein
MTVYRLSRTRYARDLSGEGARLFGGRWNHKLIPCIYTSQSRSLAVLEYTVNVNADDIPRALSMISIEIPDDNIFEPGEEILPGNWKEAPAPASTKDFGTRLLKKKNHLVIKIPSTIIPLEYNFILNPVHPDSGSIIISNVKDFIYDSRIKTGF